MKKLIKLYLLTFIITALPAYAVEGIAVINVQDAMLGTQAAEDAFKKLSEDPDFSAYVEEAQTIQAEMQAMGEKIQKDQEVMSPEEISNLQKEYQEKTADLEFVAGKIQQARQDLIQELFQELAPEVNKIVSELISAKQIKLLLEKPGALQQTPSVILNFDSALDLTDDVTSMLDVAGASADTQPE